jgi:SAM-dependent methyltransferase
MPLPTVFLALQPADLSVDENVNIGETILASLWDKLRYRFLSGAWLPEHDPVKSWDVRNVESIVRELRRDAAILDCGAFCSPALQVLLRLGFCNLHGVDLNSHLSILPSASRISYTVQDIQRTAFASGSFDFVYSASVIEHGVSWPLFLAEVRRLLKPGGLFYLSTDLVPDYADTENARAFGLPWLPLRVSEIPDACARLQAAGFVAPLAPTVVLPDTLPCQFLGIPIGFIAFACVANV